MPQFELKLLKPFLKGPYKSIDTVVETGTFKAMSTEKMAKDFRRVITIELDSKLQEEAKNRLSKRGIHNVEFILGNSGEQLPLLVKGLKEPAIFYLDAHWSGDSTVDWDSSRWKGYKENTAHIGASSNPSSVEQVPLEEEIKAIARDFESFGIIYIDDLDKFDKRGKGLKNKAFKGEDWSHLNLTNLKKLLQPRIIGWYNYNSQLIIVFTQPVESSWQALVNKFKLWINTLQFLFIKQPLKKL